MDGQAVFVAVHPSIWLRVMTVVGGVLGLGAWVLMVRSALIQGDEMERPTRVAQLYGYTVCLIAVVVFLISANSVIENVFMLSNPLRARNQFGMEPAVSSYEAYRVTVNRFGPVSREGEAPPTPSESTLRASFDALRADHIEQARFEAQRGLTTSGLLLLLSIALFSVHWRWIRNRSESTISTTEAQ